MRATLDIDDDVLEAAQELAEREEKTPGQVLSELARNALTTPAEPLPRPDGFIRKNGFTLLPPSGRIVITNALIQRLLDEADLEDAGILKNDSAEHILLGRTAFIP